MMKDDLEKFIANNREEFDDKVPPPFVLNRILEEMQPEQKAKPAGIVISFRVMRWAAACVILITGAIAFLTLRPKMNNNNIAALKPKPAIMKQNSPAQAVAVNKSAQKGIDSVDKELGQRKQILVAKIEQHSSTSQRLVKYASNTESPATRMAATVAAGQIKHADNSIIDAFVETLNNDPNSNVRLAALDGLTRFYQETYVRKQLTSSLKKQHDPIVQIAMINMLIRMRASGILEELEELVKDQNTQKPVKDCAYSGINQLRSI